MSKKIVLTGDRPTGKLHLGHYVGSLVTRLRLQHSSEQYILVADVQALTDNFANSKKLRENVIEVTKDYLAVGLQPEKNTIFLQSAIPELYEITVIFMNLVNVARLERNPTLKAEIQQKGFSRSVPVGFFCYPISQASDILTFSADEVPVGKDQLPMLEQTNEIARKFNSLYGNLFKEVVARLSDTTRLIGVDGVSKMSKSLGNAIYLSDSDEQIRSKVKSMYTDPFHVKASDPGTVEGNVVFIYLDAFLRDSAKLEELKAQYRKGGLGDAALKGLLSDLLIELITPIRERRLFIKEDDIIELLHEGTRSARRVAREKMACIKDLIGFKVL